MAQHSYNTGQEGGGREQPYIVEFPDDPSEPHSEGATNTGGSYGNNGSQGGVHSGEQYQYAGQSGQDNGGPGNYGDVYRSYGDASGAGYPGSQYSRGMQFLALTGSGQQSAQQLGSVGQGQFGMPGMGFMGYRNSNSSGPTRRRAMGVHVSMPGTGIGVRAVFFSSSHSSAFYPDEGGGDTQFGMTQGQGQDFGGQGPFLMLPSSGGGDESRAVSPEKQLSDKKVAKNKNTVMKKKPASMSGAQQPAEPSEMEPQRLPGNSIKHGAKVTGETVRSEVTSSGVNVSETTGKSNTVAEGEEENYYSDNYQIDIRHRKDMPGLVTGHHDYIPNPAGETGNHGNHSCDSGTSGNGSGRLPGDDREQAFHGNSFYPQKYTDMYRIPASAHDSNHADNQSVSKRETQVQSSDPEDFGSFQLSPTVTMTTLQSGNYDYSTGNQASDELQQYGTPDSHPAGERTPNPKGSVSAFKSEQFSVLEQMDKLVVEAEAPRETTHDAQKENRSPQSDRLSEPKEELARPMVSFEERPSILSWATGRLNQGDKTPENSNPTFVSVAEEDSRQSPKSNSALPGGSNRNQRNKNKNKNTGVVSSKDGQKAPSVDGSRVFPSESPNDIDRTLSSRQGSNTSQHATSSPGVSLVQRDIKSSASTVSTQHVGVTEERTLSPMTGDKGKDGDESEQFGYRPSNRLATSVGNNPNHNKDAGFTCHKCRTHGHFHTCNCCGNSVPVMDGFPGHGTGISSQFGDFVGYRGNQADLEWQDEFDDFGHGAVYPSNSAIATEDGVSMATRSPGDGQAEAADPHTAMVKQLDEKTGSRFYKMVANMRELVAKEGLVVKDVYPDGNCLFAAVVDQLRVQGDFFYTTRTLRTAAVDYLRDNPKQEDGTHLEAFLTDGTWEEYLVRMAQDGVWGDHIILGAIAQVLNRKIIILGGLSGLSRTTLEPILSEKAADSEDEAGTGSEEERSLYLGHLAESHYVSLRKQDWEESLHDILRQKQTSIFGPAVKAPQGAADPSPDTGGPKRSVYKEEQEPTVSPSLDNSLLAGSPSLADSLLPGSPSLADIPVKHLNVLLQYVINRDLIFTMPVYSISKKAATFDTIEMVGPAYDRLDCVLIPSRKMTSGYTPRFMKPREKKPTVSFRMILFDTPNDTTVHCAADQQDTSIQKVDLVASRTDCPIGYTRLVPVEEKIWPKHIVQHGGTGYLSHIRINAWPTQSQELQKAYRKLDTLVAFRCHWPTEASEWATRHRPHRWPTQSIIKRVVQDGCRVVPQNHPLSVTPGIEWKFSFLTAQKQLNKSCMTESRRNCFRIFKLLVDSLLPSEDCALRIHHLLNIFYYTCEDVPASVWASDILLCVLTMVSRLRYCLENAFLPDYFVRQRNTISHLSRDELSYLTRRLQTLQYQPEVSIYFLLDSHNLLHNTTTDIVEQLFEDILRFRIHGDIKKSCSECFVPIAVKTIQDFVLMREYDSALIVLRRNLKELTVYESTANSDQAGSSSLQFFLNETLRDLPLPSQWCFAFYVDQHLGTDAVDTVRPGQPSIPVERVVGEEFLRDIESTKATITVPEEVLKPGTLRFFLSEISGLLQNEFSEEACTNATHFFLREYTSTILLFAQEDSGATGGQGLRNTAAYLYSLFMFVYGSHKRQRETICFADLLDPFEEVCDACPYYDNYLFLGKLWKYFGNIQKARAAFMKAGSMRQDSQPEPEETYL